MILSVFVLGIIFTFFQINGWKELTNQGVFLTGEGSNVAGSFLYVLTLSHLVHLLGGLVALFFTSLHTKYNFKILSFSVLHNFSTNNLFKINQLLDLDIFFCFVI